MSNLWLFRLKATSNERERRRSSGEQSTGSCSVQSAASLPAAIWSPRSSCSQLSEQLEEYEQHYGATSIAAEAAAASGCTRPPPLQAKSEKASDGGRQRRADCHQEAAKGEGYAPSGGQSQKSSRHDAWLANRKSSGQREREREPETTTMGADPSIGSDAGQVPTRIQLQAGNGLTCPPQVPQVTIIRSDSTSSFIPISDSSQGTRPAALLADGSTKAMDQAKVPVVCELNQSGIRSRPELSGKLADDAGSQLLASVRQQLVSGQVPPIRERCLKQLLRPDGQQDAPGQLQAGGTPRMGLDSLSSCLADSMDNLASLIPRVRVEFYNSENTLKEQLQMFFIKDHTVSLCVRSAKLILKVLACYLYVCRVILDRGPSVAYCYGCQPKFANQTTSGFEQQPAVQQPTSKFDSHPYDGPINFRALLWVDRGPIIWHLQTCIAVICFLEAILMQYLTYKIFWKELRTLFVPGFLNCWLAKRCLEAMLNDLSVVRQSSVFSHRLTILSATVFCLIFTSACGFQHTQRSGGRGRDHITIFESIYFVVVTFSTVGYGDFKPETWPSQLLIMVMICVALSVLPTQVEQLAFFWIERKKLGASYAHHSTRHEKHVVVCSTTLRADTIMDFLNEFYAHPLLQTFSVVLLSPCELDTTMKLVLQTPTWNNRVVYIQGSALKASDLIRGRMQSAEACFILAARNYNDRSAADEHTILRSWAIRDFSPYVPQYVQIFRTENKIHVAFAEHVVCDDEFKYALLANNCLIPGTSTLVTLLLHTSQQKRRRRRRRLTAGWCSGAKDHVPSGADSDDNANQSSDVESDGQANEWKRLYGNCSANEIYHIRLSDSRFFGEYQGKSFTYASFHAHRKFGVALVGVQTDMRGTWPIMLNPGPSYVLKSADILFYINITKEENSTLMPMMHQDKVNQSPGNRSVSRDDLCRDPTSSEMDAVRPQATIRVEASSPIGPTHQELIPPLGPPPRHSIADGAGIVARSLCSVVAAAELPSICHSHHDYDFRRDSDASTSVPRKHSDPRRFLGAGFLGKRNSTASASAVTDGHGAAVGGGGGLSSRNASTMELAALASGLRKGSNLSIASTKSRETSPTRLKQVVSGLAVKMKRVKLGKSLTHLTIPRMDHGGSSASSTESFVNARGRRPSIAPVPAMMGESEEHDSDHDREQESYFAMSWQSSSESSPIVKKFVFCTTYVGVSPTLCYLLQKKKPACCLQLISACEHCPFRNARQYNWPNRCIILASDFASNGIYNFLVPLRAHFHNPQELRPIVLLLERRPSPQFIDAISWFPMVYWMPGSIDCLDDLIKAGINLAHSVVVTNKESTNSAEEDYLADCNTIVAVQTMFKMFPSVGIITELSQSSNMRFMQFRAHDLLFGGLSMASYLYSRQSSQQLHPPAALAGCSQSAGQTDAEGQAQASDSALAANQRGSDSLNGGGGGGSSLRDRIQLRKLHSQHYNRRLSRDVNSHAYKYRLPFAAGNVFSASMLDTLLYQAFVKDYMITMVRLLLGIDQAPGSGFLSSMRITRQDLWIRTYGRLYQRLCSTTCEIPLGIYRTEPLETQRHESMSFGGFASQQASYEHATEELERIEISNMVKNRLQDLGMLVSDYDDSPANRNNTFSYVIINPNCDISLREGDIIYLIRPSPIHSRKLFMHRANSVRRSSDNYHNQPTPMGPTSHQQQPVVGQQSAPAFQSNLLSETKPQNRAPSNANSRNRVAAHPSAGPTTTKQPTNEQPSNLKSCLSDGDFDEILIKVSDQETEPNSSPNNRPAPNQTPPHAACQSGDRQMINEFVSRKLDGSQNEFQRIS